MTVSDMWERPGLSPEERARAFVDAFGGHFAAAVEMIRAAVAEADAAWAQEVNRAVDAERERCARVAEEWCGVAEAVHPKVVEVAPAIKSLVDAVALGIAKEIRIARAIRHPSAASGEEQE